MMPCGPLDKYWCNGGTYCLQVLVGEWDRGEDGGSRFFQNFGTLGPYYLWSVMTIKMPLIVNPLQVSISVPKDWCECGWVGTGFVHTLLFEGNCHLIQIQIQIQIVDTDTNVNI